MRAYDLLFCISLNGDSRDIIEALATAQRWKIPTITLTSVPKSASAELSGTVLIAAARRTPQTVGTVGARIPQFVIIEIICAIIALRKKSELDSKHSARYHSWG
jgi:DNA-binding MurR/RpiR family transcriptional regulator